MGKGKRTTLTGVGWGRGGEGRDSRGQGGWGGITPGEIPNVGDGGDEGVEMEDVQMYPRNQNTIKKISGLRI